MYPDQTPRTVASDLGLHCLPLSHENDARLIWVHTYTLASFNAQTDTQENLSHESLILRLVIPDAILWFTRAPVAV